MSSFLHELNTIKNELAYDHKKDEFVKRGLSKIEEEQKKNKLKSQRDKDKYLKPAAKRILTPKGSCNVDSTGSIQGSAKTFAEFATKSRSRERGELTQGASSKRSMNKSSNRDDGQNKDKVSNDKNKSRDKENKDPIGLPPKHH